jgi:transposase-like protein
MASRKPSLIVVPQQPLSRSPDSEVVPKASRRTFSAAEKLRILNEADACTHSGQIGALLRREGLYSSHLVKWRRLRAAGQLQALAPQPRGPKPTPPDSLAEELIQLRKENARLQARLAQAELIIDVQEKVARLLGETHLVPLPDEPS